MKAIFSIHPEHSRRILQGSKTVEIRRKLPIREIDKILIYETAPTKMIVGEFSIKKMAYHPKEYAWGEFGGKAGISQDQYQSYLHNLDLAGIIEIGEVQKYAKPKPLKGTPPQSFKYLKT